MSVAPMSSNIYEKCSVNSTTTDQELKERQSEIEAMLHIRSDFFHPDLRSDYLKTIQSLASDILAKMSDMMRHCRPREEIHQLQKESFHCLKSAEEAFAKQNALLQSKTTAQRATFRSNEEKIVDTTLDFDDFTMPLNFPVLTKAVYIVKGVPKSKPKILKPIAHADTPNGKSSTIDESSLEKCLNGEKACVPEDWGFTFEQDVKSRWL